MGDPPSAAAGTPTCPNCQQNGFAVLAGEAEGGWWFVCLDCDHLWDQRSREAAEESCGDITEPANMDDEAEGLRGFAVLKTWWRTRAGA